MPVAASYVASVSVGRVYIYWILGLVFARGGAAAEAIGQLTAAVDLARAAGVGAFLEPLAFAELARLRGDDAAHRQALAEARRLFVEIGAPLRAEACQVGQR